MHLPGGDLVIDAPENSADNCYVSKLKVDGHSWQTNFLPHEVLADGTRLQFSLAAFPRR